MTNDEAYTELRLLTMARWQGDEPALTEGDEEEEAAALTPLDKLRQRVQQTKMTLIFAAPASGREKSVTLADEDCTRCTPSSPTARLLLHALAAPSPPLPPPYDTPPPLQACAVEPRFRLLHVVS